MKKQDTDSEDPQPEVTQGSEEAPSAEGAPETRAAAKDGVVSGSPKESEPATPQTDTPPQSDTPLQSDEAGGGGTFAPIPKDLDLHKYRVEKKLEKIFFGTVFQK